MIHRKPLFQISLPDEHGLNHKRHVFCPQYHHCLDDAVRLNRYFECSVCPFQNNGQMGKNEKHTQTMMNMQD